MSAHRPRLKLRGLSRRSRQRILEVTFISHARLRNADGRLYVHMLEAGGTHWVEQRITHDGLGRQIGLVKTIITAKTPSPAQESTHE